MSETSINTLGSSGLSELQVRPVAGALGAEVSGIRLSGDLDLQIFAELKALLHKHKVIFIRGQVHLNDQEQEKFASLFGTPVPHPTVPSADGTSAILSIDSQRGSRADSWHSDVTFVPNYPKVTVLRGVVLPPVGGDTVWANTTLAYETLPAPLKIFADNLRAVHSNAYDYAVSHRVASSPEALEYRKIFTATQFETEHPVVRIHPVTGERTLLLGHFVKKFVGLSQRDSRSILEFFQNHITNVDNTVRWQWKVGDVAIWDNQATQHRAVNDFGEEPRLLRRSTIEGEVPVGVDGFVSTVAPAE
ncbi:Alpha-ketoglutarate-dependent taurine dioxygenase [Acetobacter malorum]|uniref:Alpha-ketoglutarate-dependent taurine dioxygenase n=1 Tax=Acetobacter malorum TaxID=178901 RepID=A0A087PNC6_9PROT|nr:TauD/TfdA family dioxygenase [Acetobacter malorum]KFL88879.1 Alpha-ketoglutarate-dependent taurine dioxygenase [Acetobacter malorum]OAG77045.1 Alpha-ketoglutarate-dependent taurine dioxygenase [Acetobacter malorum]